MKDSEYEKIKRRMREVYLLSGAECPFCGGVLTEENIQIDHVLSRASSPAIKGNPMNLFASDGCGHALDRDFGLPVPLSRRMELIRQCLPGRAEWLEGVRYKYGLVLE